MASGRAGVGRRLLEWGSRAAWSAVDAVLDHEPVLSWDELWRVKMALSDEVIARGKRIEELEAELDKQERIGLRLVDQLSELQILQKRHYEERNHYRAMMNPSPRVGTTTDRAVLGSVIARIARKACRNGEAGNREWPRLSQLPDDPSWWCVGDEYVDQVIDALLEGSMFEVPQPVAERKVE